MPNHRSILLSLVAAAALGATFLLGAKTVHAQGATPYKPGVAPPTPVIPPELTLNPKYPLQPSAGLFASKCDFDVHRNDLVIGDPGGKIGVRFPKAQKETRVVVDFTVRVDRTVQFTIRGTGRGTENAPTTTQTVPNGIHRITVRCIVPTVRDGLAQISSETNAIWYLLSAKIRRE
jgi:hypothetical protein